MTSARITISTAWWLRLYLYVVVEFSIYSGMEPDWSKVSAVIKRGIKLKVSR